MEGDSCCGDSEFEGADFLLSDEETVIPVTPTNSRLVSVSLSPEALDWRIWKIAEETAGLLGVPRDVAALLLAEFGWRGDALIQDWFSNREGILKKCRLPLAACSGEDGGLGHACGAAERDRLDESRSAEFECPVLAVVVPFEETFALPCGHRFSNACLEGDCRWPVPFAVWEKFLGQVRSVARGACVGEEIGEEGSATPWALMRLLRFRRQSFVSARFSVSWCPSAECDKAVELLSPEEAAAQTLAERRRRAVCSAWGAEVGGPPPRSVEGGSSVVVSLSPPSALQVQRQSAVSCVCGCAFCILCGGEPHRPLRCEVVAAWLAKSDSDGPSLSWIRTNAKECPKCRQPIEKNLGCMHMKCSLCAHEFCWLCLGAWRAHTSPSLYRCNVYEKGGLPPPPTSAGGAAAAELQRYAHFYERFKVHSDGQQLAVAVMEAQLSASSAAPPPPPSGCVGLTDNKVQEESGSEEEADALCAESRSAEGGETSPGEAEAAMGEGEVEAVLREAWTQVVDCRRALKWSYAFGFFAAFSSPAQQQLFEFHQGQLERGLQLLQSAAADFPLQEARLRRQRRSRCASSSARKRTSLHEAPDVVAAAAANLAHLTSVVSEFFHKITQVIEQEIGQDAEKKTPAPEAALLERESLRNRVLASHPEKEAELNF